MKQKRKKFVGKHEKNEKKNENCFPFKFQHEVWKPCSHLIVQLQCMDTLKYTLRSVDHVSDVSTTCRF